MVRLQCLDQQRLVVWPGDANRAGNSSAGVVSRVQIAQVLVASLTSPSADYGFDPKGIAVMGFSAGGILSGDQAHPFQGAVNGTLLDADYWPDSLVDVNAGVSAVGMISSYYGPLASASADVEEFRRAELPRYAPRVTMENHLLDGSPHGFGNQGGWRDDCFNDWLSKIFGAN